MRMYDGPRSRAFLALEESMFRRFIAIACTVLLGLTVAARPAGAQTTTGTILGNIKDTTGGALPGVTVSAVN
jgi:hypothetical protein